MCTCMSAFKNVQILAVHHEETEDLIPEASSELHGQQKKWNNHLIKGVIIWWTETCSLYYWTLRSYSTFVYWCTQIKERAQIRVVRKLCVAANSGKISVSYFTENKVFYWVSWQIWYYPHSLLYWTDIFLLKNVNNWWYLKNSNKRGALQPFNLRSHCDALEPFIIALEFDISRFPS